MVLEPPYSYFGQDTSLFAVYPERISYRTGKFAWTMSHTVGKLQLMNKAPVLIILLISLADWSAADSESSFDTIRSIESLEEFAQELNRESRIGRNERPLPRRNTDPARITSGQTLYQNHCLRCHGENARGAPDWYRRDASGNFPPPPLDGSAHAWHHPRAQLVEMIRNGGNIMPPFSTILSADDIDDIIHWFQSFWPDELYQAWARQSEAFEKTNN